MVKRYLYFICCCLMLQAHAQISTFPYVEDFETAPSWTAVSVANNDWAWGSPNHTYVIQSAGSGNKCWSVGGLTGAFYNYWEQSYVKSPVFDFTNLPYPHIKFKLFYDSEYHFDGGNLQYSTNGGATWTNVGAYGDPVDCNTQNWYNYNNINYLNNPAWISIKHGWCGNTQAGGTGFDPANPGVSCLGGNGVGHWVTAEHCLTGLGGQANVMLRFTFGAGYTCNNFDGFAFDSVAISNGIPNSASFTNSCASGTTVNFTSTFAPCPQTNAWIWNFGDPASGAGNTATTQNASHTYSAPGTYTVTLIAKGGACNPPDTVTQVVHVMSASVSSHTNVACNGGTNGAATATVTNGNTPYSYTWSPSGGNAATATGLAAGNYTVTVADAAGCSVTSTVSITQPPLLTTSIAASSVTCYGLSNGSATLTAVGGTAPLTYSWTPNTCSSATATALAASVYTVTVTDAHSCQNTLTTSVAQPSAITASVAVTNPVCGSPGSATVTASGGTGTLQYNWLPSGGAASVASPLSGGSYTTVVMDANSCSVTVVSNLPPAANYSVSLSTTNVSCAGGSDGIATIAITGNSAPFSCTWTPTGNTTFTNTGLSAGTYSVQANDVNGCLTYYTVNIAQPSAVVLSTHDYTACSGQAITISGSASGGTAPYEYQWQPGGSTSQNITVTQTLTTSYTLQVSDSHSCTTAPGVITVNVLAPLSVLASAPVAVCSGTDAVMTATASGGNGNYQYTWQPGGLSGSQIDPQINTPGSYTVLVTDGCTANPAQAIVQVGIIPAPVIQVHIANAAGCVPLCTVFEDSSLISSGTITSWNWSFSNGAASQSPAASVCFNTPGTYSGTVQVVSANGCTSSSSIMPAVTVYPLPQADFSADYYEQSIFSPVFNLNNTSLNCAQVTWQTALGTYTTNSITQLYNVEGQYPVTLIATSSQGCVSEITKYLEVTPEFTFYAPNTFTPNDDAINERFLPVGIGWKTDSYTLDVFDRWGVLIYETHDVNKGWDGTMRNGHASVQQDVYVWKVELDDIFNKHHSYIGHITLLR